MGVLRNILGHLDRFTTGIIISLVLGIVLPCQGSSAVLFEGLTQAAIILLFFLYGVKLSRKSVLEGLLNWRLQGMVFFYTFVFFPVIIPLLQPAFEPLVGSALYMGLVYVACLPSTVQSSIAFTSVAGGNVPAAVCSASVSSLLGVFLTPFLAGQLSQPLLRKWVLGHKTLIGWNDRATIWLVVYTSFSNATSGGYWDKLEWLQLAGLVIVCLLILLLAFAATWYSSGLMHFSREDRIAIVFCGSKKSLAVGAPMMMAIFGHLDNNLLIPLMVFHQVQLMVCAWLARIWQRGSADTGGY